jgi:hypothetical protein
VRFRPRRGPAAPPPPAPRRKLSGQLGEDLAVEAERARLLHGDRLADLTADLLQPIVVDLAKLLGGDLGPPDLGGGGAAESAEDVANAPDREAADQERHHGPHDGLADPIR